MPESKFIDAYNRETNKKQEIPAAWLEHPHPQFKKFSKTPRQRKADREKNPAPEPVNQKTESEG
jgi:hypothetical protein